MTMPRILLLTLCLLLLSTSDAFCVKPTHKTSPLKLSAKKSPVSNFDLDAIEQFEAQLDKEEGLSSDSQLDDLDVDLEGGYEVLTFDVPEDLAGSRLDACLSALLPDQSRSFCGLLITENRVYLIRDGEKELVNRKSEKIEAGQHLEILFPVEEKFEAIVAQDIPLDILFEDEHMIVLNKAAGMVVHPAAGNWDGTVVNALAYYLSAASPYGPGEFIQKDGTVSSSLATTTAIEGEKILASRPGIVHRLDKGTTGVLVVAKTSEALANLSQSFADRRVKKTYLAITVGNPGKNVRIDEPIGRHPLHRQRMRVVPDPGKKNSSGKSPQAAGTVSKGRRALSFVDTLSFDGKLSLVKVRIETGRTHQIRVHLQHRHTPIYGDDIYGLSDWNKRLTKTHGIERPLLHAHRLEIEHPVTGEKMVFTAPMADDMLNIAKNIYPEGEVEYPEAFNSKD